MPSRGNQHRRLTCFLDLLPVKLQGSLDAPGQKRGRRPVLSYAASQNNQSIFVKLRLVKDDDQIGDDRPDQHTFKIDIECRQDIIDCIADHHLSDRAAHIVVAQNDDCLSPDQQKRENNTQDIDKALTLISDQLDIRDTQPDRKHQNKRHRYNHKTERCIEKRRQ